MSSESQIKLNTPTLYIARGTKAGVLSSTDFRILCIVRTEGEWHNQSLNCTLVLNELGGQKARCTSQSSLLLLLLLQGSTFRKATRTVISLSLSPRLLPHTHTWIRETKHAQMNMAGHQAQIFLVNVNLSTLLASLDGSLKYPRKWSNPQFCFL